MKYDLSLAVSFEEFETLTGEITFEAVFIDGSSVPCSIEYWENGILDISWFYVDDEKADFSQLPDYVVKTLRSIATQYAENNGF